MTLDERKVLVLSVIVDNYIKNKQPAGSRILTRRYNLNFSPATMRNVMLDLEESGYLMHTHTSGGKIPTPKGIKFYLDMILENFNPKIRKEFEHIPIINALTTFDEKMNAILDTVSNLSEQISVLSLPDFSKTKIKNLQFIKIGEGKVLTILLSDSNIMETKIISLEKDLKDSELKDFSEYITNKYSGYTLEEINEDLRTYILNKKETCDSLVNKLLAETKKPKIMIDGIENIFKYPQLKDDLQKLKKLVKTLEDKKKLLELIKNVMNNERIILIGDELPIEDLNELGFISSSYQYNNINIGVVGIMGPINMDYPEMLNIIESAKKKINDIINQGG